MKVDISFLDDVSLERIFQSCSDQIIAGLLISLEPEDVRRILKLMSIEHKIAIQAELNALEGAFYFDMDGEIQKFWKCVKLLEQSGEIIIPRQRTPLL